MKLWEMNIKPGMKIRMNSWPEGGYIELSESGRWYSNSQTVTPNSFSYYPEWYKEWEYFIEGNPKKKITLYRYTIKFGGVYRQTEWSSSTRTFIDETVVVALVETKKIETEE